VVTDMTVCRDGGADVRAAVAALEPRLPLLLRPLARLACNYWWSWAPGAEEFLTSFDPVRWERAGGNLVHLLEELEPWRLQELAADPAVVTRVEALAAEFDAEMARPYADGNPERPVVFMCAEFGVHRSLPFYAGGLGVLAGDFLKESSDQHLPVVGVGLFYAEGSFHQRLDISGLQHEYWLITDSDCLPAALVTGEGGAALTVSVPVRGRDVIAQVWRVDVGRVPLYLLDANRPENSAVDRWITDRLYVGDREVRLAQYALLGIGGIKALAAMGLEPSLIHLNDGHAALATLELLGSRIARGASVEGAKEAVRALAVFTTHTPVLAGNESFSSDELQRGLPTLAEVAGLSWDDLLALGRVHPDDPGERFGLTPLALRLSGAANGVSRLHGQVARAMWQGLWPSLPVSAVPIEHVSNGVHLPTWMAPEMQALFDRYVEGWRTATRESAIWDEIDRIPDEELWGVRCALRARLAAVVRARSVPERLGRGESLAYAESAGLAWREDLLTIGFARRIATYKRLYLITREPDRAVRLLTSERPVQMVIAGRAHPQDEEAKRTVQALFAVNDIPGVGSRVVFLENHELGLAKELVRGCDLWVNLPRPMQEASGTSGMKSASNGGLQLSVRDGWWDEACDGSNGWGVASDPSLSIEEQDRQDADAFFDLLENEIIPLFNDRDGEGVPRGWVRRMKASLRTIVPQYSARRMVRDYLSRASARHTS